MPGNTGAAASNSVRWPKSPWEHVTISRPCRLRRRENADQPAAVAQLPVELFRHDLGRAVQDDDVVGPVRRIPVGRRRGPDMAFSPARRAFALAASAGSLSVAVTREANLPITAAA